MILHLKTHFTQEKIIKNISIYETSYQISKGKLLNLYENTNLNKELEIQYILGSIYEVLKDLDKEEQDESSYENEIQKQASMDLLQEFVNEKLDEIKQNNINIENLINEINDDKFFNPTMKDLYKENYPLTKKKYSQIINKELSLAILESLLQLENN